MEDSETWSLGAQERTKLKYLRNLCSIKRVDRMRNSLIRERCGCELSVLEKVHRNVVKWFGYVERMGEGGKGWLNLNNVKYIQQEKNPFRCYVFRSNAK